MRLADYKNDPQIIDILFSTEGSDTPNSKKLLEINTVDTLIDEIIAADLHVPLIETFIKRTFEKSYSAELLAIALKVLKAGGREKFIRENASPMSQQDFNTIVNEINDTFCTYKTNKNISPTEQTAEAFGPLLYPCSGADVTYPVLLCPNVNEFYLVDEHPLFEPLLANFEESLKKVIGESELNKGSSKYLSTISEAEGAWPGYDCTFPQREFSYVDSNDLGLIILLRLKQLCGMDISSLEIIAEGVFKIQGCIDDTTKTIYYVSHKFGEESLAFDWLQEQVQKRNIGTFFFKAFSASIMSETISRSFLNQFQTLIPSDKKKLTVISDICNDYHNGLVPSLIDPKQVTNCIHEVEFDFGYAFNKMMVAKNNVFIKMYLTIFIQKGKRNSREAKLNQKGTLFFQKSRNNADAIHMLTPSHDEVSNEDASSSIPITSTF